MGFPVTSYDTVYRELHFLPAQSPGRHAIAEMVLPLVGSREETMNATLQENFKQSGYTKLIPESDRITLAGRIAHAFTKIFPPA